MRLFTSPLLPRNSVYTYTVEQFFYDNLLWRVREVDLTCYTDDIISVADVLNMRLHIRCNLMSATQVMHFISQFVHADDWVDVVLLNGTYIRNIQRLSS